MLTLSRPARLVACVFVVAFCGLWSWNAPFASADPADTEPASGLFQLLPPIQDPDDDDDGVPDEADPAPTDPAIAPTPKPDIISPVQDSDGDGLPNVQDPDDDNGGVSDQDDPAPFDPVIEPTPPSSPTSPIHDDDGDGIPNVQDPDDDNDGTADDADPGVPASAPVESAPGGPVATGENVPVGGGGTGDVPVVTALPATGSGRDATGTTFLATLAGSVVLLGSALIYAWRGRDIA